MILEYLAYMGADCGVLWCLDSSVWKYLNFYTILHWKYSQRGEYKCKLCCALLCQLSYMVVPMCIKMVICKLWCRRMRIFVFLGWFRACCLLGVGNGRDNLFVFVAFFTPCSVYVYCCINNCLVSTTFVFLFMYTVYPMSESTCLAWKNVDEMDWNPLWRCHRSFVLLDELP